MSQFAPVNEAPADASVVQETPVEEPTPLVDEPAPVMGDEEVPEVKDDSDEVNMEDEKPPSNLLSSFDPQASGGFRETGEEDLGNREHLEEIPPATVNDDGHLVAHDDTKVFTTVEETVKDGSMVLDSQGRQPGVYLQDLEAEARNRHADRMESAFEDSKNATGSAVSREVNVSSSPLPPVTVPARQGEAVNPAPAALDNTSERPVSEEEVTRNT